MKANKIVSNIKTAGLAVSAAFTMFSCGAKQMSDSQMQSVKHKTDSVANVHNEYRMASGLLGLCELKITRYRNLNKDILKLYAKDYIKNNIKNLSLRNFMFAAIEDNDLMSISSSDTAEFYGLTDDVVTMVNDIRKNQRWFNDLILYLSDKYNEKQLLNSEFFKVVNNPELKRNFEYNMKQMETTNKYADFASERKKIIYNDLWNKTAKEVQKQR